MTARPSPFNRFAGALVLGVLSSVLLAYGAAALPGTPLWQSSATRQDGDRFWLAGSTVYTDLWPSSSGSPFAYSTPTNLTTSDAKARWLLDTSLADTFSEPGHRMAVDYTDAPGIDLEGVLADEMRVTTIGVPFRSLWCWENHGMSAPTFGGELVHRLHPAGEPGAPLIPYLPLWRGLVLNVLVHGACWWLVLPLLGSIPLRARWRRRRGRCGGCGYDRRGLGTDALCPECGAAPG